MPGNEVESVAPGPEDMLSSPALSDLSYVADTLGRGTLAVHGAVFRLAQELPLEHLGSVGPGGVLLD
jgi:hypothetical protein